jgi:hypothetical protein
VFGFLVVCGTLYELRQQFLVDKRDENDHYDAIDKRPENNYASLNKAFVNDESKSNGDVIKQSGNGSIQNGNTITELPAGYMHHKEDNKFTPAGAPNKQNVEAETNHYVTVTVNSKVQPRPKQIQKKDGNV